MWPVVLRWGNGSRREEERLESGCVRWVVGFSHRAFYRVVGRRKASSQGEGDSSGGTSMASVMGDRNREWEVMGCGVFQRGKRQGSSTVPEADNIAKSGVVAGEAKGGSWRLEVKDDQRKLGRWTECAVRP
jgi:hypothetical protein